MNNFAALTLFALLLGIFVAIGAIVTLTVHVTLLAIGIMQTIASPIKKRAATHR